MTDFSGLTLHEKSTNLEFPGIQRSLLVRLGPGYPSLPYFQLVLLHRCLLSLLEGSLLSFLSFQMVQPVLDFRALLLVLEVHRLVSQQVLKEEQQQVK